MEYDDFIKLTEKQKPSKKLSVIHLAIWYILKDNWDMSHKTVQKLNTEIALPVSCLSTSRRGRSGQCWLLVSPGGYETNYRFIRNGAQ